MKIAPMSGMAWSLDILTGHKPFPTFQKERKGKGFQEVLGKEMDKRDRPIHSRQVPQYNTPNRG